MSDFKILQGDALSVLKNLPTGRFDMCVTSPPYYGLRNYESAKQIGLEETPEEYINKLVLVFREVRRVLKDDGTLWLNIGDSYATRSGPQPPKNTRNSCGHTAKTVPEGYKYKDLIGIPWLLAFALRADGWYLRQDIIWQKPNCMPESVKDRCTKSHEYIFLLSKSQKYFYNAEAISEPTAGRITQRKNKRSVWTINTAGYKGAHFAVFPEKLVKPCILAGSRPGGIVLDPFSGSGTTGAVAIQEGREYIGIELNHNYCRMSEHRIEEAKNK